MKETINFCFGLLALTLLSCQPQSNSTISKPTEPKHATEDSISISTLEDAHHFFIVGDWGRNGENGQRGVAHSMATVAKQLEPEYIFSTGDNFYPNGVASTSDYQWISSFEKVYHQHELMCNWYVCLGNHDYRGNPEAQIEYSSISQRWHMPDHYYSKLHTLDDDSATVLFLVIDTNPFQLDYYRKTKYSKVSQCDTSAQKAWIKNCLDTTSARWKIVIGHHPMYSGGKRKGKTNDMIHSFKKLFETYGVDAYFAGHEHDLQVHKNTPKTLYVVSGAGSKIRPTGNLENTLFAEAKNGFFNIALTSDSMQLIALDTLGNNLFEFKRHY